MICQPKYGFTYVKASVVNQSIDVPKPTAFPSKENTLNSVDDLPEVVTIDDIAKLLRLHVNTVRADLHRRPDSLPPRIRLPGRRTVRFLKADVLTWLNTHRTPKASELVVQGADGVQGHVTCAK